MNDGTNQIMNEAAHIDPEWWRAELYAAGKLETLGMLEAKHQPTPGLMSYLHDPARHAYRWHRRVEFGGEASDLEATLEDV
ncbi:MAG: hypothetical protein KF716_08825 [Anaerolineae bacterium]|nr:hypothetical protein [Anaerolineae bacterium]